jgi:hypothetical protein
MYIYIYISIYICAYVDKNRYHIYIYIYVYIHIIYTYFVGHTFYHSAAGQLRGSFTVTRCGGYKVSTNANYLEPWAVTDGQPVVTDVQDASDFNVVLTDFLTTWADRKQTLKKTQNKGPAREGPWYRNRFRSLVQVYGPTVAPRSDTSKGSQKE